MSKTQHRHIHEYCTFISLVFWLNYAEHFERLECYIYYKNLYTVRPEWHTQTNTHSVVWSVCVSVCKIKVIDLSEIRDRKRPRSQPRWFQSFAYGKPNTWLIPFPERGKWKKGWDRGKKTSWWASGKCSEDRKTSLKCYRKKKMALLIGLKHLRFAEVEWPRVIQGQCRAMVADDPVRYPFQWAIFWITVPRQIL